VNATRPWALAAVAIVCAVATWLIVRMTFASLPPLPWTAVPSMLLLAVAEGWIGRNLRARFEGGRGGKPLAPIAVARMAALAKASSLGGAAFGGFALGFLAYTVGSIDKVVPRGDAIAAGATVGSAAILVAAAMYLERCCRAPGPPGDQDRSAQRGLERDER
jgi:hypothetical protein